MAFSRWGCFAFLLALCCATSAVAQGGKGNIRGRVVKEGTGIVGVAVLAAELKQVEITDGKGRFAFDSIPARTYTLIFTLGKNTETRANVGVLSGRTRELDVEVDWETGVLESVVVTAAAERAAKIVDAPAAVTSIMADEIEREAAHGQLPKVLEFTPGAEVTQSGLYDFNFNTRGFNSSLNRRVSTYIDGRDVGVVLLGAQEWAAISGGLGDVASLEFIRGPSAALYGANASSGVINITTKSPRESMGNTLRFSGGELNTRAMDFRRAGQLAPGLFYKVMAGTRNSGDFSISRNPWGPDNNRVTLGDNLLVPEYSKFCGNVGDSDCLPEEKTLFREQDNDIRFGTLRVDKYLADDSVITFEAGTTDIEGPVFQTGIGRVQIRDAKRPFYRVGYYHDRWNVLAHYINREGDQANLNKTLERNFELTSDTERYGIEAQTNWSFGGGRGRLVVGAAHTEERVDTDDGFGNQTVVFQPIATDRQAVFSQFDWRLNDSIKFVAAGRVDANTLHDTQFSPKVAMVYSITPKHSFRFTFNKAFQVANYSEFFLHARVSQFAIDSTIQSLCNSPLLDVDGDGLPDGPGGPGVSCEPIPDLERVAGQPGGWVPVLAAGNNDLKLEKTAAWEIGYSGLIANRAFITMDYYNSKNKDFITDLVRQSGTSLGELGTSCGFVGVTERQINPDYSCWVGPSDWENTFIVDPFGPDFKVADALRNFVADGSSGFNLRLAQDLNPEDTVIIATTYSNVGEVETQGVDLGVQYFINESWTLQFSYSWFDFDVIDDTLVVARNRFDVIRAGDDAVIFTPNTPEHKASVSISYKNKNFQTSLSGRWSDDFYWSAGVFQGDIPAYSTVDLNASYTFNDLVSFGVNIANLRSKSHRQTFGGDLLDRRALTNLTFSW